MNAFDVRAALYVRGGQCGRCERAVWAGGRVRGCGLGAAMDGQVAELAQIMGAVLYQQARMNAKPCPARVVIPLGPDAYLAEDLPADADPVRAAFSEMLQDREPTKP